MDSKELSPLENLLQNVVIRERILKLVQLNDLLRIRRVGKSMKYFVEDFIKTKNVSTSAELQVTISDNYVNVGVMDVEVWSNNNSISFAYKEFIDILMNKNLPTHRTIIISMWQSKQVGVILPTSNFMEYFSKRGSDITKLVLWGLRVPLFSSSITDLIKFFPNVTTLELRALDVMNRITPIIVPQKWSKLAKINVTNCSRMFDERASSHQRAVKFLVQLVEGCLQNLEQLSLPFRQLLKPHASRAVIMRLAYICILNASNLKLYELDGCVIDKFCDRFEFTPDLGSLNLIDASINSKIRSIKNPSISTFIMELPNLEKIKFLRTERCQMPLNYIRHNWMNLNHIDALFTNSIDGIRVEDLWMCVFGVTRPTVTSVRMIYEEKFFGPDPQDFPRNMDIVVNLPNLKILHLGSNVNQLLNLSTLWSGLSSLEKLTLDTMTHITMEHIIGTDIENPVFWNLKKLNTLEIIGIDFMHFTDDIFSKVLREMPIQKLLLHSTRCLMDSPNYHRQITLEGVTGLLGGKFENSVVALHLGGLRIDEDKSSRKDEIERMFKSWYLK